MTFSRKLLFLYPIIYKSLNFFATKLLSFLPEVIIFELEIFSYYIKECQL